MTQEIIVHNICNDRAPFEESIGVLKYGYKLFHFFITNQNVFVTLHYAYSYLPR